MIVNMKELVELTGLCDVTLNRYVNKQGMPYHRVGTHHPFYVVEEVNRWFALMCIHTKMSTKGKL